MWNKIWWLKGLFVFLVLIKGISAKIYAQKKWDGGGNDSLWSNPLNWHPDGVPTSSDTVVLNNQWIPYSYHVYFPPGMVTSHALSLSIEPSSTHQISVTLPNTNTGAPGLMLYAGDTALTLNNRSIFYNASGAAAGNAIQLTGKLMIKNGGKYIHQTQRGNALLIANLATSAETQKGVFELNVPGNSAYTLSASGRNFGSLVLSGQNSSRKTYTSSGSNQLTIRGDLLINEQATFSSSLTHNINISGDMTIKGRLYINPITSDTVGRCLITTGSNNKMEVSGEFNQGSHFRKWLIGGNYQLLHSNINIDHANVKIHVQSGSTLDFGLSIIKGSGEFISDSNCNFLSSAVSIIGSDTLANIQTEGLNLHPAIHFTCYGSSPQATGNRFPALIGKLKIEKDQDNVFLTKYITISDSLLLINGKLISTDTISISILRYCNLGNEKSYFTGRINHLSTNTTLFFPIGKGNLYAPIEIVRITEASQTYQIVIDSLTPTLNSYTTLHPIQQLSSPIYWTIKTHQQGNMREEAQFIYTKQSNDQSACIASLDNLANQWKLASGIKANDSLLAATLDSSATQLFTLGKLSPQILPLSSISLQKKRNGGALILTWKVDDDENAMFYLIESSSNGSAYNITDTMMSIKQKGSYTYSKTIKLPITKSCFYRIKGIDGDGRSIISNTVVAQTQQNNVQLFPNPSRDALFLNTSEAVRKLILINTNGEIKSVRYEREGKMLRILINELKAGYYYLVIDYSNKRTILPFVKQ
jgi:hypothetical protein